MNSSPSTSSQNNGRSFANVTKNTRISYPKRDQGIIIDATEDTHTEEIIFKIGDIIGPQNIIASARKNHRVYAFLSKKQYVDTLINEHKFINIEDQAVEIKRLITPAQRLVISNVCPTIPHEVIEQILKENGIKPVSPLTFLRAGFQREEYRHILSFRRQIYITEDEERIIPNTLIVNYDDTEYRIFLSTDTTCFICKQRGHTTNNCPQKITTTPSQNTNNINGHDQLCSQKDDANILNPTIQRDDPTPIQSQKKTQTGNEDLSTQEESRQETPVEIYQLLQTWQQIPDTIIIQNQLTIQNQTGQEQVASNVTKECLLQKNENPKRPAPSISSIEDETASEGTNNNTTDEMILDGITPSKPNQNKSSEKIKSKLKKPRSHSPEEFKSILDAL